MMSNPIQDAAIGLFKSHGRTKTNSSSGWLSANAVCCIHNGESADTRSRGGIISNPDGGISYSCFNCSFKTSYTPGRHLTFKFRKLLSWMGADDNTVKRLVIDAIRVKDLIAPEDLIKIPQEEIVFKSRPLPEEARSFQELNTFYTLSGDAPEDWHNAVIYAAGRGIDLTKYDFYWTPETAHKLNQRLIVPLTWRGQIIGYTGRATSDEVMPKFHNSYENNCVFNVDRQLSTSKFVIVCEGPFDAMSVDGVAVLGNYCHEQQADIIDSLGRQVIVVPDFDIGEKNGKRVWPGANLIDQAMEYGWDVSYPIWSETCKDINEAVIKYGKLFVLQSILAAVETSRLKIELLKKRMYN